MWTPQATLEADQRDAGSSTQVCLRDQSLRFAAEIHQYLSLRDVCAGPEGLDRPRDTCPAVVDTHGIAVRAVSRRTGTKHVRMTGTPMASGI